jgi:hypothetical protein
LLHFALIGAVVFGGYHWLNGNPPKADKTEPIHIGEGDVRWLKQTWSSQWLRDPTAEELSGLVNDLVGEQLLAREAEAMGLGENDTIIRRRLAQKLTFVIEDTGHFPMGTRKNGPRPHRPTWYLWRALRKLAPRLPGKLLVYRAMARVEGILRFSTCHILGLCRSYEEGG